MRECKPIKAKLKKIDLVSLEKKIFTEENLKLSNAIKIKCSVNTILKELIPFEISGYRMRESSDQKIQASKIRNGALILSDLHFVVLGQLPYQIYFLLFVMRALF